MSEYTLTDGTKIQVNENQICYKVQGSTGSNTDTLYMSNGQILNVQKNKN